MPRDIGRKIGQLAESINPAQLLEMLSLHQTTTAIGHDSFLASAFRTDPVVGPLIKSRLMTFGPHPTMGRGIRATALTRLGILVMLARLESELRDTLPEIASAWN